MIKQHIEGQYCYLFIHQKVIRDRNEARTSGHSFCYIKCNIHEHMNFFDFYYFEKKIDNNLVIKKNLYVYWTRLIT